MSIESTTVLPGDGWYRVAGRLAPGAKTSIVGEYLARANGATLSTPLHVGRILWFDAAEIARFVEGAPPVGNLPGWRQTFLETFDTPAPLGSFDAVYGAKWRTYPSNYRDTSKRGIYDTARVVSVKDGILSKRLHTHAGVPRVACLMPKNAAGAMLNQPTGRYSIRARMDRVDGFKVAWLLWPESQVWPRDGEIDFPERDLVSPGVAGFVHKQGATVGSDQSVSRVAAYDATAWHVYTFEWTPGLVVMFLDGVEIGRHTDRVPNTPMRWTIQTETEINSTPIDPAAEGLVQIDWAAVWVQDTEVK